MNIIVTGGYGFIGSNLYDTLRELADKPTYPNFKLARSKFLPPEEIYNRLICKPAYTKNTPLDVIYHLAAYSRVPGSNNPENKVFENNIVSLQNSLELARQTKAKLVFTSTSYCNVSKDANYYAFSKDIGEQLCLFYHKTYGVDVAVCRLFNVYGNQLPGYPEWKFGVIDKFLLDKSLGCGYTINNTGEQRRDYVHVHDVVQALLILGLQQTDPSKIYEVGTGITYSVNEIARMIFGDEKPCVQINVSGEIMNSQSLGGIEYMRELGWKDKIKLEDWLSTILLK